MDASPCLEGVCSGAVLFEDVLPACPLSRVLNEEDESCERALTKQWTMEVAAPAYKGYCSKVVCDLTGRTNLLSIAFLRMLLC